MRSTVIPAQITTVEDKIIGDLSVEQVLLLMVPVFFGIGIYVILPPVMNFTWYKVVLVFIVSVVSVLLAIRIKDKLVLDWMFMYIHFTLRPAYYVFNKNDPFEREISLPHSNLEKATPVKDPHKPKSAAISIKPALSVQDEVRFEQLLAADNLSLRIMPLKKGGVHVAIEQVKS